MQGRIISGNREPFSLVSYHDSKAFQHGGTLAKQWGEKGQKIRYYTPPEN